MDLWAPLLRERLAEQRQNWKGVICRVVGGYSHCACVSSSACIITLISEEITSLSLMHLFDLTPLFLLAFASVLTTLRLLFGSSLPTILRALKCRGKEKRDTNRPSSKECTLNPHCSYAIIQFCMNKSYSGVESYLTLRQFFQGFFLRGH